MRHRNHLSIVMLWASGGGRARGGKHIMTAAWTGRHRRAGSRRGIALASARRIKPALLRLALSARRENNASAPRHPRIWRSRRSRNKPLRISGGCAGQAAMDDRWLAASDNKGALERKNRMKRLAWSTGVRRHGAETRNRRRLQCMPHHGADRQPEKGPSCYMYVS